jgi:hypothetical protein
MTARTSKASSTVSMSKIKDMNFNDPKDEETFCFICADLIPNYIPKFFEGIPINPACTNCDDENDSNIVDQTATENRDTTSLDNTTRDSTLLDNPTKDSTCLDSTPRDSTCLDSISSLDMIGLDSTSSMNGFTMDTNQVNSDQPSRKSLFPPWTCEVCFADIPLGHTWEQALHSQKHRDDAKV